MTPIEKELARKLAWAVISTLAPPANLKYRVRAWAWRVACKMVSAKSQFRIDKSLPPPDNGMAGGGAAEVSYGGSLPMRILGRPPLDGGEYASPSSAGLDPVRSRRVGTDRRGSDPAATCSNRSCGRWSGSRCVRRPAGSDYRWGWHALTPSETSPPGSNSRRHADGTYDRECYLEKSR